MYLVIHTSINLSIKNIKNSIYETQTFTLSFQPVDVKHYTAEVYCSIKNLQNQTAPIQFKTSGTGVLPKCHVDLPKNDWISFILDDFSRAALTMLIFIV